jgi:hypothetical protein
MAVDLDAQHPINGGRHSAAPRKRCASAAGRFVSPASGR